MQTALNFETLASLLLAVFLGGHRALVQQALNQAFFW